MTNYNDKNGNDENEKEMANEAWSKMEDLLRQEPVNPAWATWKERGETAGAAESTVGTAGVTNAKAFAESSVPVLTANGEKARSETAGLSDPKTNAAEPISAAGSKRRKRMTRFALAAAAAAVIVTAVTPAGNQALAGILNKFTMQDVVLVQESDMENMIQMVYDSGESRESVNKYGSFSSVALDEFDPDSSAEKIRESLGYAPIKSPQGASGTFSASIGSQTEMKLNVTEVNETLKRLGAKNLFPREADGKMITLTYPASLSYNFGEPDEAWAVLNQSDMPSVEFDSSFPLEETMDAVVNFPYLPENLRKALQQSAVSSGELPLPMNANGQAQSFDVSGVTVTYTMSESLDTRIAFWIKNGQLFEFNAHRDFKGGEAGFLDFAKGLAAQ